MLTYLLAVLAACANVSILWGVLAFHEQARREVPSSAIT
jgi:hypothetical protein